jgi:hypothetical protein
VSVVVLLDSGPLGLVTNPNASPTNRRCAEWLESLLLGGLGIVVPEIADHEVRRELLRAGKVADIRQLDRLKATVGYTPLTTETMLQAAAFWAEARRRGRPTTDPHALDGDVILAAQAAMIERGGDQPVIATTNLGHFSLFADARLWEDLSPPVEWLGRP